MDTVIEVTTAGTLAPELRSTTLRVLKSIGETAFKNPGQTYMEIMRVTIKRARTSHYRKMRRCIEPFNNLAPLSPLGCISNTSGYDFRKGQLK
jgi:hypothetical protein